ncbi:uncharacterized protein, partial [Diadema antillarum]
MDLQQTVQDLAEAWVAANTDTSFSRTQHLQVYGSTAPEEAEEGTEPSTSSEGDFNAAVATPSSPPHGPSSGDNNLASSHSRKRKQSSPQQRREGAESVSPPPLSAAASGKGDPPPMKRLAMKDT